MTNKKLIKGCKARNPKVQQILYERFSAQVMGICRRYGKSREDSEDIFQEAFIRIFEQIEKVRDPQALVAWIKKTVVNTAINHYKKQKKYQERYQMEENIAEISSLSSSPDVLHQLNNETLLQLIKKLPDGYRIVFNLYVIEGYNHQEIAEMLDTHVNNSKSQLYKARKALKKMVLDLNLIEDERRI